MSVRGARWHAGFPHCPGLCSFKKALAAFLDNKPAIRLDVEIH